VKIRGYAPEKPRKWHNDVLDWTQSEKKCPSTGTKKVTLDYETVHWGGVTRSPYGEHQSVKINQEGGRRRPQLNGRGTSWDVGVNRQAKPTYKTSETGVSMMGTERRSMGEASRPTDGKMLTNAAVIEGQDFRGGEWPNFEKAEGSGGKSRGEKKRLAIERKDLKEKMQSKKKMRGSRQGRHATAQFSRWPLLGGKKKQVEVR